MIFPNNFETESNRIMKSNLSSSKEHPSSDAEPRSRLSRSIQRTFASAQTESSKSVKSHPGKFDTATSTSSRRSGVNRSQRSSSRFSRARRQASSKSESRTTSIAFRRGNSGDGSQSHELQHTVGTNAEDDKSEGRYEVIDLRPAAHPADLTSSFTSVASHLTADSASRELETQLSITDDLEGIQRNDLPSHWDVLPPSHWNLAGSRSGAELGVSSTGRGQSYGLGDSGSVDGSGSGIWSETTSDSDGSSSSRTGNHTFLSTLSTFTGKRKIYIRKCLQLTAISVAFVLMTAGVLFLLMDQMGDTIMSILESNVLGGVGRVVEHRTGGRMMVELAEDVDVDGESVISWVTRCEQLGILPS
mmetsp:Transcript_15462/g.32385  ORF Transcript_15462/g.32385 Transcript_15462/m.32385 type:complete len:360 (-) Transcript_15462:35-1114(-)